MTCKCESSFQADIGTDNQDLIIMWAHQFVNSHRDCGFMNPMRTDTPELHKVIEWDTDVKMKEKGKEDIE